MELPGFWIPLNEDMRLKLDEELRRELKPNHRLYGLSLSTVARNQNDGRILAFISGSDDVAEIRLSWMGDYTKPPLPSARVYRSLSIWRTALLARQDSLEEAKEP